MSSLRCPFTAKAAMASSMENPVSLGSTSTSRGQRRFSFPAFHPTTYLHSGANCAEFGSLNCVDGDPFAGFSCYEGKSWRNKVLRATGKNANTGEDADDESCDLSKIEEGKEILAQQKNLIQQIAERRKLVSSIKKIIADGKQYESPHIESAAVFPSLDLPWSGEEHDRKYKSGIPSDSYTDSSLVEALKTYSVGVSGDFGDEDQEPNKTTAFVKVSSPVDASKELNETIQSMIKPSSLQTTSDAYSAKQERLDLTEANVDNVNSELRMIPEEMESKSPPLAGDNVMNVIMVAAECAPWSKTGGLGDVAGALPKALARRGHRVMVVAPLYGNYHEAQETGARKRYKVDGQDVEVTYFHAYIDGVDFVFMESPMFRHCQNDIYGGARLDILKRMILFCKAAVEVPWHVPCGGVCYGDGNLVFIANDWHTALLPVYLKAYYRDNGIMKYTRAVLVIHNIAHQGRGPVEDFAYVDLPDHYKNLFTLYDPVGGHHFNIFAAGLKTADRIVTVSHGYAWELKTLEGGWGLHGIISENDRKLRGIVNGIDAKEWNPKFDVHLKSDGYTNYSLETLQTGKPQCKAALQRELGLPVCDTIPLVAFIGRLDNQKGVDLIAEAIPWMVGQDVQLIMLGSGRPDLEEMLRWFESQHNDKVRGWVGFSVKMAHRITAGTDVLLMPSKFEPCGLNQLYAMMYGTVPVVHATGGLRDTVQQFDPFKESGLAGTMLLNITRKSLLQPSISDFPRTLIFLIAAERLVIDVENTT
ncbi:hypothetical protein MRB53_021889 [Persea americana]|uniref:Uncharacterized protein n=1 Tax=Persea americana TaxID=3435 RepID=A0ACC2L5V4_PERAE|nr:hypothetical protein MRB53_021889 [Persea americana]